MSVAQTTDRSGVASCGIAVMAKASLPGKTKTRLVPPLTFEEAAAFNTAFIQDVVANIAAAGREAPIAAYMAYGPAGAAAFFESILPPSVGLIASWHPDFGDCLFTAIDQVLARGHASAVVLNSDSPTLPTAASTYSSDFSAAGIERMLKSALELAKITSEDPHAGIPEAGKLGSLSGDLHLYHEDVCSSDRIEYARRAEKAALDADPRIKNSEGGSFDAATGRKVLANSHGFVGEYRRSYCSVAVVPIAQDESGGMQRDYWYSVARSLAKLDSARHKWENTGRQKRDQAGDKGPGNSGTVKLLKPLSLDSPTASGLGN